jgi:hypothetical protein
MKHKVHWLAAAAFAVAMGFGCSAAAMAADQPEACNMRLALTLTPDVPNSQDPGFLGSILSSPTYQLTWLSGSDTNATVLLTGPGPSSQCQNAVNKLSKDAHVLDVKVLAPGESAS